MNGFSFFSIVFIFAQSLWSFDTPKETLSSSASFFEKGQYQRAIDVLAPLNVRTYFDDSEDMKRAYKILAIAYVETNNRAKAIEAIRELLFLDSSYQFNPFDTPNSVIELARQEQVMINDKNKEIEDVKNKVLAKSELNEIFNPKTAGLEKLSFFFPFGINHFVENSRFKGAAHLSLQSMGLFTNILSYWWKESYLTNFGGNQLVNQKFKARFEVAQTMQYIGLGIMCVSYVISVIDALLL